jgi:hypothetical protein
MALKAQLAGRVDQSRIDSDLAGLAGKRESIVNASREPGVVGKVRQCTGNARMIGWKNVSTNFESFPRQRLSVLIASELNFVQREIVKRRSVICRAFPLLRSRRSASSNLPSAVLESPCLKRRIPCRLRTDAIRGSSAFSSWR